MRLLHDGVDAVARARLRLGGVTIEAGPGARYNPRRIAAQRGSRLVIGAQSLVDGAVSFERPGARVTIGARTFMNAHLATAHSIEIGDDVLMAWGTTVVDHDSHALAFSKRAGDVVAWSRGEKDWTHVAVSPVRIGDKAWIGLHVIILKGVQIGEGAVVGAGSVVTRDVAPWTVVAGNPARQIRTLTPEER